MEYYILEALSESHNGVSILEKDRGFIFMENTQGDLGYHEFPNFEPIFSGLHLSEHTLPPDFIFSVGSYGGRGFLMSEKAMNILKEFKLPEHRFYKIPEYSKDGKTYTYFWLQLLIGNNNFDFIDYNKSTFTKSDFWGDNPETIIFRNSDLLVEAFENLDELEEKLIEDTICFSEKFKSTDPDLFYIYNIFDDEFIISERLKKALEENQISGLHKFKSLQAYA